MLYETRVHCNASAVLTDNESTENLEDIRVTFTRMFIYLMRENEGERKNILLLVGAKPTASSQCTRFSAIRDMEIVQLTVTKAAVHAFSFSSTFFILCDLGHRQVANSGNF